MSDKILPNRLQGLMFRSLHADCMVMDLVIYYESGSLIRTLSDVMKLSPSMGFRFRVSGVNPAPAFPLLTTET